MTERLLGVFERYGFKNWGVPENAVPADVTPAMLTRAMRGFKLIAREPAEQIAGGFRDFYQAQDGGFVTVEAIPFCSAQDAREQLLDCLASYALEEKLPELSELNISAGEIGFGCLGSDHSQIHFCRSNVFISVRCFGGDRSDGIREICQAVDREIC